MTRQEIENIFNETLNAFEYYVAESIMGGDSVVYHNEYRDKKIKLLNALDGIFNKNSQELCEKSQIPTRDEIILTMSARKGLFDQADAVLELIKGKQKI